MVLRTIFQWSDVIQLCNLRGKTINFLNVMFLKDVLRSVWNFLWTLTKTIKLLLYTPILSEKHPGTNTVAPVNTDTSRYIRSHNLISATFLKDSLIKWFWRAFKLMEVKIFCRFSRKEEIIYKMSHFIRLVVSFQCRKVKSDRRGIWKGQFPS